MRARRSSASSRVAIAIALVAGGAARSGAEPAIERLKPPAARQGETVDLQISGLELDGAAEVFFEDGRIAAAAPVVENDKQVTVRLTVPADCPLGPHRVRVRTNDGLSQLRMFQVHAREQLPEHEPNNTVDAATPLEPGRTVWGTLSGEDVDVYRLHLRAGDRIAAVVEAVRLDQQMLDAHVELVDAGGFVLAACDDHPLLAQDAALAVTAPREGDYFLRVRESAYGGGDNVYLLHVGDMPIPHAAWPPGGTAGTTVDVAWLGDPAGGFSTAITLPPPDADGSAAVRPVRDGREAAFAVPLRVAAGPVTTAAEPNDKAVEPTVATAPAAIAGRMDAADDVDWIRVTAAKGTKWNVTGWGRRLGSPIDLVINAHRDNEKRERITGNDDADGPDSVLVVTTPDEGGFLLRVNDFERRGGPEFTYWIDVQPLLPAVNVSVPPAQTKTQQRLCAAVPRGNRTALVFNTARTECGDPVRLEFDGLPAGVTALAAPIAEPAGGGVVVFEAAAAAEPGTRAAGIRVLRHDQEAATLGGLRQSTPLVFGDPNRECYRSAHGRRLPVAVVEEAPVEIDVLPPATAIARRGTLDLAVRVKRAEGWTGKVRLELPFKPPGIGCSAVEAKDDQQEVVLPISANADAPVQEWSVAVTAVLVPTGDQQQAKQGGRRIARGTVVASRPVKLAVVEPLVELAAEKAVVEQGQTARLVFKPVKPPTFTGTARARLVGLPLKTECAPLELAAGAEQLEFSIAVAPDAPPGKHDGILCRLEVPVGDAWMVHQTAATSLRIDKPLPGGVAARGAAP